MARAPYRYAVGLREEPACSEQLPCPAGAPRWMKMVLGSPTPHTGGRIPPARLAMRSFKHWCREPDEQLDPDTCRHQGLWPPPCGERSTHCRVGCIPCFLAE